MKLLNKLTVRAPFTTKLLYIIALIFLNTVFQPAQALDRNPLYMEESKCAEKFKDSIDIGAPTNWETYGYSSAKDCRDKLYLPNYYEILNLAPAILTDLNPRAKIIRAGRDSLLKAHTDKLGDMSKANRDATGELLKRMNAANTELIDNTKRQQYNLLLSSARITNWSANFIENYLSGAYYRSTFAFADLVVKAIVKTDAALARNDLAVAEKETADAILQAGYSRAAAAQVPTMAAAQAEANRATELANAVDAKVKTAIAAGGGASSTDADSKVNELIDRATALKDRALEDLSAKNLHEGEEKLLNATDIMLEVKTITNNMPSAKKAEFTRKIKLIDDAITSAIRRILKEYSPSDIKTDFDRQSGEIERAIESAKTISNPDDKNAAIATIQRKIDFIKQKIQTLPNNILEQDIITRLQRNLTALNKIRIAVSPSDVTQHNKDINKEIYANYKLFRNISDGSDSDRISFAIKELQADSVTVQNMVNSKDTSAAMVSKVQNFVKMVDSLQLFDIILRVINESEIKSRIVIDKINEIQALIAEAKANFNAADITGATQKIEKAKVKLTQTNAEQVKKLLNQSDISKFSTEINKLKDIITSVAVNTTEFPVDRDAEHLVAGFPDIKTLVDSLKRLADGKIRMATTPPTVQTQIADVTAELTATEATIAGGGSAGASGSGGATESKGASTGTGTGAGAGAGGAGAGTSESEIDRLLKIAEQAAAAVTAAIAAGDNLSEIERQAKIIADILAAARATGDDSGKLKRILKLSKEAQVAIDSFKARAGADAAGGAGTGASAAGTGAGTGGYTGAAGSGSSTGAGTSKPIGTEADAKAIQQQLRQLLNNIILNDIAALTQGISRDYINFLPIRASKLAVFKSNKIDVVRLLSLIDQQAKALIAKTLVDFNWSTGYQAMFRFVQYKPDMMLRHIGHLYDFAYAAVDGTSNIHDYGRLGPIIAKISEFKANPTTADKLQLDNLKYAIELVRQEYKDQINATFRDAKVFKRDIEKEVLDYNNTIIPGFEPHTQATSLVSIANGLITILEFKLGELLNKLMSDMDALDAQVEAIRASIGGTGASAGAGSGGAGAGFGSGAGAGAGSFERIKRDIKQDFDRYFFLNSDERNSVNSGTVSFFTEPDKIHSLRPILEKMHNLLRELEVKNASATVTSLPASEKTSIDQIYHNVRAIRENLNNLMLLANETLNLKPTLDPLFKNFDDLHNAAYHDYINPASDPATTYQKIQATIRALDPLEHYSARLEHAKNTATELAKNVTKNIRMISDNNSWLEIKNSNYGTWNSRTAWMDFGDGLRNIVKGPYDKLQNLKLMCDTQFKPWLAAHAGAAHGGGGGGASESKGSDAGGAGASAGTSASDRWKTAGAAHGVHGGAGAGTSTGTGATMPIPTTFPEFISLNNQLKKDPTNKNILIAMKTGFNASGKTNAGIVRYLAGQFSVANNADAVSAKLAELIAAT